MNTLGCVRRLLKRNILTIPTDELFPRGCPTCNKCILSTSLLVFCVLSRFQVEIEVNKQKYHIARNLLSESINSFGFSREKLFGINSF